MIELDFKAITKGKKRPRFMEVQEFMHKLKFFHTWLFYYFYSADQKFLKNLVKCKFQFSTVLFIDELDHIYRSRKLSEVLWKIYAPKLTLNQFKKKYQQQYFASLKARNHEVEIFPFVVPLVEKNHSNKCDLGFGKLDVFNGLHVDMSVIDRTIQNVREKLQDIINLPAKRDVKKYLGLDEPRRNIQRQHSFRVRKDMLE